MFRNISIVLVLFLLIVFGFVTGCNNRVIESPTLESSSYDDSIQTSNESSEISDTETMSETSDTQSPISSGISDESPSPTSAETTTVPTATSAPQATPTKKPSATPLPSPTITPKPATKYYLAGSWNGYLVNDENYIMMPLPSKSGFYYATVELKQTNRDAMYDGHWYKVTEGNWNKSYGIEKYAVQPAPVKYFGDPPQAIGLGSIWIDENLTLTVYFDSVTKTIYDTTMDASLLP